MKRESVILLVVTMLVPALMVAGTTGKIKGKVTDRESKESLVGATVSIEGTTMGAATDVEGEYTIVNVPAGVYSLKATFVGYSSVSISNVRVNNDLTTELMFTLSTEAVALQQVDIVAERPLVNKSATNAVRITTSEDIASLPVRGVNNVIALSPGVVLQDNTLFIRGGRQDEVGYYLEGVSITNPMVGGRAVTLVQDAIEEIQVQAGGYNAEFGFANSGIVQQQLKTGTSDWKASLQYQTDNVTLKGKSKRHDGKQRLGAYWYGYNEMTGTLSGPVMDERFKFFGLFNYNYQRDPNPQPYPGINLGQITDNVSGNTIDLVYPAGPALASAAEQYTYTGTMTMDFRPVTLRFAGTYTDGNLLNPWSTARVAGNIANVLNTARTEVIDQTNGSGSLKLTHMLSPTTYYEVTGGYFRQTQQLYDPYLGEDFMHYGDSVANANAGVVWQRSQQDIERGNVGRFTRPTRMQIFTFAFNSPGDVVAGFQKYKRENISLTASLYSQLNSEHTIKVGGDFQRFTIRNYSWNNELAFGLAGLMDANNQLPDGDPLKRTTEEVLIKQGVNNYGYDVFGEETSDGGIHGAKHPVFASAFIQDKIEYQDLVVNIGLRYDYIDSDSKALVDPTRPEQTFDRASNQVNPEGLIDVASFSSVSPRLGMSFPVTDRTVFHAQYGKFVQQTRLRDIYQGLYATGAILAGGLFNQAPVGFDIRPTRTTQYEIGFTQQIGEIASFDITGYYKDIQDQVVYDQLNAATGSQFGGYGILRNGDFATTKGVELTFNMRRQKRLQVNANLSFNDARGTGSFPNSLRGVVGAPLEGGTIFRPQYISPLEFNNSVRGSLNLDYRFAKNDGPAVLEQLGASALFTFNSGHPYTRGIGGDNLEGDARDRQPVEALNSSTTPWVFQVDLRVDKSFSLFGNLSANVYVFVINLFDTRNIVNTFLRTGSTDDDGYLSNPDLGGRLVSTFGPQYEAMYRAINIDYYEQYQAAVTGAPYTTTPFFYGPPRQVRLGVRLEY